MTHLAALHSIAGDVRQIYSRVPGGKGVRIPERRKHPRYGVQLDAKIDLGSEVSSVLVTDIGMGGMFLVTDSPLLVGASFTARILLHPPLVLHCVVRRVLPGRGMGVQFDQMSDMDRSRLEKLLAKLTE